MATAFSLESAEYLEVAKAVRPHIDRSGKKPILEQTRVRFDGERVAFEATDAYSFIRATLPIGERTDTTAEPFDVLVPGEYLWSLRPAKMETVTFTVLDGSTANVVCGVITVRLDLYDGEFPDFDKIAKDFTSLKTASDIGAGVWFNPSLLAKWASLPSHTRGIGMKFISPLMPMHITAQGKAEYNGVLMPIRPNGQVARHENWPSSEIAAAA